MASNSPETVPPPCEHTTSGAFAQSPEGSEQTTYKKLRRQLASALPSKHKDIMFSHLQRAVEALQRPVSSHLLDVIMLLDNTKNLALIFSAEQLDSWLYQQAVYERCPEQYLVNF